MPIISDTLVPQNNLLPKNPTAQQVIESYFPQIRYRDQPHLNTSGMLDFSGLGSQNGFKDTIKFNSLAKLKRELKKVDPSILSFLIKKDRANFLT